MAGLSSRSRQRLALIGVEVWQRRVRSPASSSTSPTEFFDDSVEPNADEAHQPRIRLLSGAGDWVLVQQPAWRGDHADMMADIQATIGPERCRFGQWAEAGSAGVGVTELQARGVVNVLTFGAPPDLIDWPMLIQGPSLEALVTDSAARQALWQQLVAALGSP